MQVTINLDVNMVEKLEKFRERELGKVESLIERYGDAESEDNVERANFLISHADDLRKLPMDKLLFRFLM